MHSIAAAVAASASGNEPSTATEVRNLANSSRETVPSSSTSRSSMSSSALCLSSDSSPSPAVPCHMSPMTDLSSSRVTTPSPLRSNIRNMRSASEPAASVRPASVKLPNRSSAAALAALTSSASASAAPGSSLNPPLYAVCAADPISAAACMAAVRT